MERSYRFPHRQLLGWIYFGLGLGATSFVGVILINVLTGLRTYHPDFTLVFDTFVFALPFLFLLVLSPLLYFLAAYKLLANKGAARTLIIASSILTVFNGLFLMPWMRGVPRYAPLPVLALGIYGIGVAVRIESPPPAGLYVSTPLQNMRSRGGIRIRRALFLLVLIVLLTGVIALSPRFYGRVKEVEVPADSLKEVKVPFDSLKPTATFKIGRNADWVLVTDDAVWVTGTGPYSVQRIDPTTERIIANVSLPGEACSGLAFGFGSVWVPLCGDKPAVGSPGVVCTHCAMAIARVDVRTNSISTTLPLPPEQQEVRITVGADSVWMVDERGRPQEGTLSRINPDTNAVGQRIAIPPGSFNLLFSEGMLWIAGGESNVLTFVDAGSGHALGSIPVGPWPRFVTAGGGSIWTLNQVDGTISRVDAVTKKVTATIAAGITGRERGEGDIDYGADSVWATVYDTPLTRIDRRTNKVVRQWVGRGGDSLRFGFDSIWLTDYEAGLLLRIPANQVLDR